MSANLKIVVFACDRSHLHDAELPPSVRFIPLPCAGRISVPLLLSAMAQGADGVLVLGRHQQTCRLRGAEDPARARLMRTALALDLVGLQGTRRLLFVEPDPGPDGPLDAVLAFEDALGPVGRTPLGGTAPPQLVGAEGLDTALGLLRWMARQSIVRGDDVTWLDRHGLPTAAPGAPVLEAGELPLLDLLTEELLRPLSLPDAAGAALAVLTRLGAGGVGIRLDPVNNVDDGKTGRMRLDDLLLKRGDTLPRPVAPRMVAFLDGDDRARRLIEALGHVPLDAGVDPLPAGPESSFTPGQGARLAAELLLQRVAGLGARALLVDDPLQLCRWATLTRQGSWRASRPVPVLGVQLAYLGLADEGHQEMRRS